MKYISRDECIIHNKCSEANVEYFFLFDVLTLTGPNFDGIYTVPSFSVTPNPYPLLRRFFIVSALEIEGDISFKVDTLFLAMKCGFSS